MVKVIDGETEIKNNKNLKTIKNKLEKLLNIKIIQLKCIRVPEDFYEYIIGLTENRIVFHFRAFKDEKKLNIEIDDFIKKYKNLIKRKEEQNS